MIYVIPMVTTIDHFPKPNPASSTSVHGGLPVACESDTIVENPTLGVLNGS